jgi:ferrous iron transport protein A
MDKNLIPLDRLPVGSLGKIKKITCDGISRSRMLDLGLTHGTLIESLMKSPFGDPSAYKIRGAVIALRSEEASKILVEAI